MEAKDSVPGASEICLPSYSLRRSLLLDACARNGSVAVPASASMAGSSGPHCSHDASTLRILQKKNNSDKNLTSPLLEHNFFLVFRFYFLNFHPPANIF